METNNMQECNATNAQGKVEAPKRIGKTNQLKQDQIVKRSKVKTIPTVSIEELNERKSGNLFEGDVLVVYKVTLDKVNKTREVLRADVTDIKAEMTMTVNVKDALVQQYEDKFIAGMGIRITEFDLADKSDYDRGDSDCIIVIKNTTIVETIPRICNEYKFIPSSTISQLLNNPNDYPIGTVGALVVGAKKIGTVATFELKDGHTQDDRAQLEIHPSLAHHYIAVDAQLKRNETPALLFRNIVTKQDKKNTFRTGSSTYICNLNDTTTLQMLNELLQKTYQVCAVLRVINPFSNPFTPFCTQCNYKFDGFGILQNGFGRCMRCDEDVAYELKIQLKMMLTTVTRQTIYCSLNQSVIQQLIPAIANMNYEEYLQNKSKVVFCLRDISLKGNYTLTQNNVVTHATLLQDHEQVDEVATK